MRTGAVREKPASPSPPADGPAKATGASQPSFGEVLARQGGGREHARGGARGNLLAEGGDLPLASFHVPPPILQAPPPIVRPRFQASPVAEAAQAIADRVVQSARLEAKPSGRLEFVVEMRPEVLGGLEVRVRFEGGQVHAVFGAAAPEVRAVLEAQCHALRGALQERGLQVGEIRVDSRQPSHGGWGGTREEHPGQGGGDAPGSGGGSRGP